MFFGDHEAPRISKRSLRKTKPENVFRLARYLKLHIEGMSVRQVISLIRWRLHPNRKWH